MSDAQNCGKTEFFTWPSDPFVTLDVSDVQNCGKMQILDVAVFVTSNASEAPNCRKMEILRLWVATLSSFRACQMLGKSFSKGVAPPPVFIPAASLPSRPSLSSNYQLHPLACCESGHTVRLAARLLFHLTFVCVGSSLSSCVRSCNSRWFFPVLFSCISIFSLAEPAWAYCPARPLSPPFLNYPLPFPSLISLLLNWLLAVIF